MTSKLIRMTCPYKSHILLLALEADLVVFCGSEPNCNFRGYYGGSPWKLLKSLLCYPNRHLQLLCVQIIADSYRFVNMPLTNLQRKRIISLSEGQCCGLLRKSVESCWLKVFLLHTPLQRTLSRYLETGSFQERKKRGRLKAVPQHHYEYIDELMAADDELTASDLYEKLKEKYHSEVSYSKWTASRTRQNLGWTFEIARYCQAIRETNMVKCLQWCKERLLEKEDFSDVIFTDESSIQLERHRRKCFRRWGALRKLKYKHKHSLKVHMQAGISKNGATGIVIFTGITTATRYGDILSNHWFLSLSRLMKKATGYIRTMIPSTQAATSRVSLKKMVSIGGSALPKAQTSTVLRMYGLLWNVLEWHLKCVQDI